MHKRLFVLIFFINLLLCQGLAFAQKTVTVNDAIDEQMFDHGLIASFDDSTRSISFKEILTGKYDSRFLDNTFHQYPSTENYPNTYWVRIKIKPNQSSDKNWLLELYDQTIDEITAYIPGTNGNYDSLTLGDNYQFSKRKIKHKNFIFPFPNKGETTQTIYFKCKVHELNNLIVVLRSDEKFISYALIEYLMFGLFYGMIIIIALYNLLTFSAFRKIQYVYYTLYILCVGLYEASQTGAGYHLLWPNSPVWNQVAFGVFLYLLIIFALLFTRTFLNLKKNNPFLNKLLTYTIVVRTVWLFFVLMFDVELLEYREIEIIPLSFAFFAGIQTYRGGLKHARYFIVAYGMLFTGFVIKTLVNLEIVPFNIVTHYSITISFLFEMLFLAIALGDKIRLISFQRDGARKDLVRTLQEKDRLKDKVNRELEEKVLERTQELHTANEQLEKQSREITELNLKLDLQNRELQKDIEETTNKRIMKKLVDFEEFKTIFPDRFACHKYLNELKMKREYKCLKCLNEKYFENIKKFSRRCTRCGYNESITTGTIFKGLKFPIEKAFYIVYLVVVNQDNMTLEKLADIIDLRPNTCWAFRNKVKQALDSKKLDRNQLNSFEDWEFLLI